MESVLQLEHIQKSYYRGKKVVLRDVTLSACSGECIGILGANGCGKSTLLSILAGVQVADSGTIRLKDCLLATDGRLPSKRTAFGDLIGYVPQNNPLIDELSAYDNLRLWYCDSPRDLDRELAEGVLAMLGIPDYLDVAVKHMSGGMKKRLNIGCAVAKDPDILLLDEPGAALDLICKERIGVYLKNYRSEGKTILLATHEEREIELCDRHFVLKDGVLEEIAYDGNIHHLAGML